MPNFCTQLKLFINYLKDKICTCRLYKINLYGACFRTEEEKQNCFLFYLLFLSASFKIISLELGKMQFNVQGVTQPGSTDWKHWFKDCSRYPARNSGKAYKTDQNSEDYKQVKQVITFQHIIPGSWIINEFENLGKCPGHGIFESYLPIGKAGIQLF